MLLVSSVLSSSEGILQSWFPGIVMSLGSVPVISATESCTSVKNAAPRRTCASVPALLISPENRMIQASAFLMALAANAMAFTLLRKGSLPSSM